MNTTYDILILGGGAHGASLAFHLAARKIKVAILEKNNLAAGATGRSSGLVRMHYDLEPEAALAWQSFQWFRDWKERIGGESGFTRTGFIQLVERAHVDALQANTAMLQRLGVPAFLVNAGDVKRLAPSFLTDDFDLAAYEPESGYADPVSTAASLMNAARQRGADFIPNCEVTGITLHSGRVSGVSASRGNFSAPIVVNAAGAWAKGICEMAGVDLPLSTWRHEVMFVQRPPQLRLPHPTVIDFPNSMYFRPEGGLTLVGLEDGNPLGEDPEGETSRARAGFVERAIERLCKRIPAMQGGALHSAHGGYDGITPDQHPVIGPIGPEGFWLDTGFSGTGFKISPATGLCLAEWILDGAPKTVDISLFTPTRFEKGIRLASQHPYESIWR
ncbi:MAG: Sarcosine oxidase subunit beta [Anaerolineales bacterium]|nr:Sarcosine oxidase subunit beta [Anaerolineales bacterium]